MEIVGCVAVVVLGALQLWAAFDGAVYYLGPWFAVAVFAACFALRFTLPLMVLALLGAWVVWGWWLPWAALFVAPMLAIALPSLLADAIAFWWRVISVKQ